MKVHAVVYIQIAPARITVFPCLTLLSEILCGKWLTAQATGIYNKCRAVENSLGPGKTNFSLDPCLHGY